MVSNEFFNTIHQYNLLDYILCVISKFLSLGCRESTKCKELSMNFIEYQGLIYTSVDFREKLLNFLIYTSVDFGEKLLNFIFSFPLYCYT